MKKSQSLSNLAAALVAFQSAIESVGKTTRGYNYNYADLPSIWNYIRPVLAANGLAIIQANRYVAPRDGTVTQNKKGETFAGTLLSVCVETTLLHTSGEFVTDRCYVPFIQADPQGAGSAITYGRRYGLSAILGIVADEDDDGAKAMGAGYGQDNKPKAAPKTAKANPAMENKLAEVKAATPPPVVNKDYFGSGAAHKFEAEIMELCRGLNTHGDSITWTKAALDTYVLEQFDEPLATLSSKNVAVLMGDLEERLNERKAMSDNGGGAAAVATSSHSGPVAGDAINDRQIDTIGKLCGLKDLKPEDVALQYSNDRTDDLAMLTEAEATEAIKGIQKAGR